LGNGKARIDFHKKRFKGDIDSAFARFRVNVNNHNYLFKTAKDLGVSDKFLKKFVELLSMNAFNLFGEKTRIDFIRHKELIKPLLLFAKIGVPLRNAVTLLSPIHAFISLFFNRHETDLKEPNLAFFKSGRKRYFVGNVKKVIWQLDPNLISKL
jgi:hypothetical protein